VSVIGATIVAPALYAASIPGLAGLAVGSTLAGATIVTVHRRAVTQYVTVVTGSVYAHRAMEGFALAAAYLSGTAVGVVGTLVLTIHATFEIAVVSLGRDGASRRWAFGHAVGIQSTLLVTGALGVSVGSLPDPVRSVVVATAGGVLLVAGMQGLRTDGDANDLAGGAEHG
jgi:zinc transporter ZupT